MTTGNVGNLQPGWQAEHARRYRETNGEDGHLWNGVPTLLLTTRGKLTGESRTTPLIYGKDGDTYLIVASRGGAPTNPKWYNNLRANPEVELQVMADRFPAKARAATTAEKPRLWKLMTAIWPAYDDYQGRTQRTIPLIILEPI